MIRVVSERRVGVGRVIDVEIASADLNEYLWRLFAGLRVIAIGAVGDDGRDMACPARLFSDADA